MGPQQTVTITVRESNAQGGFLEAATGIEPVYAALQAAA